MDNISIIIRNRNESEYISDPAQAINYKILKNIFND